MSPLSPLRSPASVMLSPAKKLWSKTATEAAIDELELKAAPIRDLTKDVTKDATKDVTKDSSASEIRDNKHLGTKVIGRNTDIYYASSDSKSDCRSGDCGCGMERNYEHEPRQAPTGYRKMTPQETKKGVFRLVNGVLVSEHLKPSLQSDWTKIPLGYLWSLLFPKEQANLRQIESAGFDFISDAAILWSDDGTFLKEVFKMAPRILADQIVSIEDAFRQLSILKSYVESWDTHTFNSGMGIPCFPLVPVVLPKYDEISAKSSIQQLLYSVGLQGVSYTNVLNSFISSKCYNVQDALQVLPTMHYIIPQMPVRFKLISAIKRIAAHPLLSV